MTNPEVSEECRDWWAEWFNEEYLDVYRHRNLDSAEAEARAAIEWLGLEPGDTVLDLCCGGGRHIAWLREAGIARVIGLDFSVSMLRQARDELGERVPLVRADMRGLPFQPRFDAVLVFFTSFGYFARDEENESVIRQLARVLRPGGGFLFDYLNAEKVKSNLEPETVRTANGATVREVRRLMAAGRRIRKEIFITRGEETQHYEECVRLFSQDELLVMFTQAGIPPDRFYGDFDGSPLSDDSDRLIFVRYPRR